MEDDITENPNGFEPAREIPLEHRRDLNHLLYHPAFKEAIKVIQEENLQRILGMRRMDVTSTEQVARFYYQQGMTDGVEYVIGRLRELTVEENSDG